MKEKKILFENAKQNEIMFKAIIKKLFLILILTTIFILSIFKQNTFADVGSFEDYDSGSSFSSGWDSDWDSGSSWDWGSDSGSSWGSGSSYGSNINIIGFGFSKFWWVIVIIIIIISIAKDNSKKNNRHFTPSMYNKPPVIYNDEEIVAMIRQKDPDFSITEFESFAKEVFIKLQNAWTERDWEKIRPFESEELFAQHKAQLDGYIKNKQINVMERISVNGMHLVGFEQAGGKDILKIDLSTRMGDYIIDEETKAVIRGEKNKEYYHVYTLTFVRKTGVNLNKNQTTNINLNTKNSTNSSTETDLNTRLNTTSEKTILNTTNCPNCGAPTTITSSGRCEYCGSVITTEDHGWVLANLTRRY